MDTIEESGFLSDQIVEWIKKYRVDNAEYFALCKDVNRFAQKTMLSLKVHNECLPEILVASLLARAISNFQGMVLLAERGMINEAETLLRCMLEVRFALVAVARNTEFAFELLNNDLFEEKNIFNACLRSKHLGVAELQVAKEKLDKVKQEIKAKGLEKISIREIAEKAGLLTMYDSAYKKLSGTIHASVRSLNQYLETGGTDKIKSFLWGPDVKGIDIVLLTGVETILDALEVVFRVFSITIRGELDSLSHKFQKTWEVFCNKEEDGKTGTCKQSDVAGRKGAGTS